MPILLAGAGSVFLVAGCGARRSVADQPPSPPLAQPSSGSEESPKTGTDAGTAPVPSKPASKVPPSAKPMTTSLAGRVEQGNASWYGVPFHGRRASSGETYDMN